MRFRETSDQLRQAASRHLADSHRLLGETAARCRCRTCAQHRIGAMYIAGYAIECALKAHAIDRRGKTVWQEVVDEERGKPARTRIDLRSGHSLRQLIKAADLDPASSNRIQRRFELCASAWRPDLRYASGTRNLSQAKALVLAVAEVHDWIRKQPT